MAQRVWLTLDNTSGLSNKDLAVINRAGRNMWDLSYQPSNSELMELRMAYRPGMSADDLMKIIEDRS